MIGPKIYGVLLLDRFQVMRHCCGRVIDSRTTEHGENSSHVWFPKYEYFLSFFQHQATKSRNDMDEDTWRRIKNMEQTRQISAMKSHIEKLEAKLGAMQSPNNNAGRVSQNPIVEDKLESKRKHKSGFSRKSQKKQNDVVAGVEKQENRPTAKGKEKMLKSLFLRKKSGRKSEGSTQEDFVLVEDNGDVAQGGKKAEKAISENDHKERSEDSSCERKSKRYFRRKNDDSKGRNESRGFQGKHVAATREDQSEKEEGTIYVQINDKENPCQDGLFKDEIQVNPDLDLDDQAEFEHLEAVLQESDAELGSLQENYALLESHDGSYNLAEMKEELRASCGKLEIEVKRNLAAESCDDKIDGIRIEENADDGRNCQSLEAVHTNLKSVSDEEEIPKQIASDTISQSNLDNLEKINSDLKERVSDLEEKLWLAAEERRNMQAMLALQKEKALKNLAFKFEEINRKTLREFRGIFESKLQEINDEKLKLQEKLLKYEKEKAFVVTGCEKCDLLKNELTESENKCEKLSSENATLRRRCRKLSGDLGKVKNVIGAASASVDIVCSEVGTQTDYSGINVQTISVQTEDSVETSLKDIHLDVKSIASKVSVLSNNISASPRSWSEFSGEDRSFGSDSLPSTSPKNSATTEETLHRDLEENSLQSPPSTDISLGLSQGLATEESLSGPDSQTEIGDEAENVPNKSDDGDSGIFGSDLSHLSEYDIEKHLHKIHEKYTRISEELDNYANSKLSGSLDSDGYVLVGRIKQPELDPEIQKIVDDVNRKYEEYFKTKLML